MIIIIIIPTTTTNNTHLLIILFIYLLIYNILYPYTIIRDVSPSKCNVHNDFGHLSYGSKVFLSTIPTPTPTPTHTPEGQGLGSL